MNVAGRAAAEFVDPACALCGARERTTLFSEHVASAPGVAEHLRAVVRCASCGLVYVTPRRTPEALIAEVYGGDYWRSAAPRERGYADYLADEELYVATFRARWRRIAGDLPRSGRALDDKAFSLDHFDRKLLKLGPAMNTAAGRALAMAREETMAAFLAALRTELTLA